MIGRETSNLDHLDAGEIDLRALHPVQARVQLTRGGSSPLIGIAARPGPKRA
jgi:hypothetical protein